MRKVCVINSFNYEKYLSECILSAVNQTLSFDKIIIVDDGSKDGSTSIIRDLSRLYPNLLTPIFKEQEGQASTFNTVEPLIYDDDQVFILDSDDLYAQDYLELCINEMGNKNWEIAFVAQIPFKERVSLKTAKFKEEQSFAFKKTSAIVRKRQIWIGNPSSTISVSGRVFKKIFPYPYYKDFKTRADDILVFGASIIGAEKTFIPSVGSFWRIHAENNTNRMHEESNFERQTKVNRLIEYFCKKYSLNYNPSKEEYLEEINQLNNINKIFLNSILGSHPDKF